ncbi:MAG: polysaccharide pyruvyl transferase family protein [Eubacterium sp.]|nr:polysaccharide pyruvyl transferase family protein [Eubacterium sp.]
MKVSLITYSRTRNYGGILQAFGLYKYLCEKGYNTNFIDYIPSRCNINDKKVFVNEASSKSRLWGMNAITKKLFGILRYPGFKKSFKPFISFMESNVSFTDSYYSIDELNDNPPQADVYITGSDQVWNSQFAMNQELDTPFYLPFVKEGKKISYASSFGREFIPEKDKKEVKGYLEKYDYISVREESGQKILKKMGIDSRVVVDPTILCPINEWEKIASKPLDSDYYLLYQVTFNKSVYDLAKEVAEKNNKKLVTITMDGKDKLYVKKDLKITPDIQDWLSYIKYADGVITDSFHASVFSILFESPFIVNSGTRKGMSSRIHNLLASVGLEKRNVDSFDSQEVASAIKEAIDWKSCENRIETIRKESIDWIENAINS